jgi:hypothetical protein
MTKLRIPILSKLSRLQRILLAAVVLVVVLFVLAAGNGSGSGTGSAQHPGGIVGWLGDLFGGSTVVDRKDLSAPCLQPDGRLVVKDTCTLHVAAGSDDVRKVKLTAQAPVTVTAKAPGQDTTGTRDVAAGDELDVAVDQNANDIEIKCDAAQACVVELPQ